jgi:hypothetical protein
MQSGLLSGQDLLPAPLVTCTKLQFGNLTGKDYPRDRCADWSYIEINLTKAVAENEPWSFVARYMVQ